MTLAPASIIAALVSTKLPIFTPSPSDVPGRNRAKGPTEACLPIDACTMWENEWITAPSDIDTPGPITTNGSMVTSLPNVVSAARYTVSGAISGQGGHRKTFRVACKLTHQFPRGFGLSIEQAWPLIKEWNEQCEPPWSDGELLHKLEDAIKKR